MKERKKNCLNVKIRRCGMRLPMKQFSTTDQMPTFFTCISSADQTVYAFNKQTFLECLLLLTCISSADQKVYSMGFCQNNEGHKVNWTYFYSFPLLYKWLFNWQSYLYTVLHVNTVTAMVCECKTWI